MRNLDSLLKLRPIGIATLCVFAFAALCLSSSPSELPTGHTTFTLPFAYIDNRVFVEVHLDGKGPYHFILDTGADLALSDRVARELKLAIEDAGETSGVGEHRQRAGRARIPELTLGDLHLTDLDAYVLPDNDQSNVFGTKPVDGILGQPVFERLVVKHEYANRRLVFTDPKKFAYSGTGTIIPIDRPVQIPVIDAQLDGVPGRFGVDTGARSSLLLYGPFCERNHLREKYNAHFEGVTGWGIGGPVRSLLARAHEFQLSKLTIHDPVIRISTQKSGLTTSSSMAGLIGPDILSQFDVTFDYSRHRMILEPNSTATTEPASGWAKATEHLPPSMLSRAVPPLRRASKPATSSSPSTANPPAIWSCPTSAKESAAPHPARNSPCKSNREAPAAQSL